MVSFIIFSSYVDFVCNISLVMTISYESLIHAYHEPMMRVLYHDVIICPY